MMDSPSIIKRSSIWILFRRILCLFFSMFIKLVFNFHFIKWFFFMNLSGVNIAEANKGFMFIFSHSQILQDKMKVFWRIFLLCNWTWSDHLYCWFQHSHRNCNWSLDFGTDKRWWIGCNQTTIRSMFSESPSNWNNSFQMKIKIGRAEKRSCQKKKF